MKTNGDKLKDAGCALVLENNTSYTARFMQAASDILNMHGSVKSEDVTARIGMPVHGSSSAVGASMRAFAKREGLVVTDYVKSKCASSHSAIIAVWERSEA